MDNDYDNGFLQPAFFQLLNTDSFISIIGLCVIFSFSLQIIRLILHHWLLTEWMAEWLNGATKLIHTCTMLANHQIRRNFMMNSEIGKRQMKHTKRKENEKQKWAAHRVNISACSHVEMQVEHFHLAFLPALLWLHVTHRHYINELNVWRKVFTYETKTFISFHLCAKSWNNIHENQTNSLLMRCKMPWKGCQTN